MGSIIFLLILFFIIIPKLQQSGARRGDKAVRIDPAQRAAEAARRAAQSAEAAQRAAQSVRDARQAGAAAPSPVRAPKYQQPGEVPGKSLWERLRGLKDGQSEQALAQKKALGLAGGVAGALLAGLFAVGLAGGLSELVWSVSNGFFFTEELLVTLFSALCTAGGGLLAYQGFGMRRRAKSFEWYRAIIGGRRECPVADLARATGRKPKQVLRELQDLVRHGYFPLGFVDEETACFYADNDAYRQRVSAAPAAARTQPEPEPQNEPEGPLGDAHLREYKRQLERVREPAVREKAARLCEHAEDIFAWVKLHPECTDDVRRFCSYYLPTANKLLSTYNEVAPHTVESAVAAQIEGEVLRVLDTMTTAFRGLMDNLLQNTAVDMQAEISALETILAQEGLTQDGILH